MKYKKITKPVFDHLERQGKPALRFDGKCTSFRGKDTFSAVGFLMPPNHPALFLQCDVIGAIIDYPNLLESLEVKTPTDLAFLYALEHVHGVGMPLWGNGGYLFWGPERFKRDLAEEYMKYWWEEERHTKHWDFESDFEDLKSRV